MDGEDPEVLPPARLEGMLRERWVRVPAGASGAATREPARVEDDPAEEVEPVGEGVQPREGHASRAYHQRHKEVREPGEDRHDDEEDHRRPVHREHLVVRVAGEDVLVRPRELRAHQQGDDPAGHEEDQAREDVEDPDPLVVDGRQPARVAAARDDGRSGSARDPNRHSAPSSNAADMYLLDGALACSREALDVGEQGVHLPRIPAPADRGHLDAAVSQQRLDRVGLVEDRVSAQVRPEAALPLKAVAGGADAVEGHLAEVGGTALLRPGLAVVPGLEVAVGSAFTVPSMCGCSYPQNSPHWPLNVPVRSARNLRWSVLPGIASSLPCRAGIHQLWSTSSEVMSSFTSWFAGIRIRSTWMTPLG